MRLLLAALPLLAASLRLEGGWDFLESFTDAEDLPEEPEAAVNEEEEGEISFAALRAQGNRTLRETAFKNVLLVVHCRLKSDQFYASGGIMLTSHICFRRQKLFKPYAEFFPEVVYWTNNDCQPHPTNPHICLPQLLKEKAAGRDGVFYIHFDALIKPLVMARDFDLKSIAVFNSQHHCKIGNQSLVGCHWGPWPHQRIAYFDVLADLEKAGISVDRESVWYGMDDVFYLPSAVFKRYGELVHFWSVPGIHHEVAGPMMWRTIGAELGVKVVSLGCTGGCCKEVFGTEALAKDFRCGHPFRLMDPDSREPWQRAMVMS